MIEIKFFGRGGQGAVTAAQTCPQFGAERRGAPVAAFVRFDEKSIAIRNRIYAPDVVIVMDFNLFKMIDPLEDIKPDGMTLLNYPDEAPAPPRSLVEKAGRLFAVDATRIAHEIYGKTTIPITNIAILGAFCAAQDDISLQSVLRVLPDFFPSPKLNQNFKAAEIGMKELRGIV